MKLEQEQLESITRVVANMVFGFEGSNPKNPPQKGLKMATETLKESIQCFLKEQREEILAAGYDEVSKTYSPDAIFDYLKQGDSADLAGGGFQIGYNQAIDDILRSLKKGETK